MSWYRGEDAETGIQHMRGTYTRTEIDKYALTEIDQIARYAINTYIHF